MTCEMAKAYDPSLVEDKWYTYWEHHHFFHADPSSSKSPYCIILPPPNITGSLHMGHALVDTVQDTLIRQKRMQGYETLWMPGVDHAGIATQTVVEKNLIATHGKRRKDFSREEFLHHVWDWKKKNEKQIVSQLKKMGCSCDWSRLRFTMDEESNTAVRKMFKKMFDDKLIYRGDYLVNWDPVTQTALADDEVEYEDKESFLWYFKYPLENNQGFISIATTRPETMLGDVAVAVSPHDERYQPLIGMHIKHPMTGRLIPIIADHYVDKAFGTGAVKITPAHDHNDYEIALRHHLEMINIMTPDGCINAIGGQFEGLSMQEARKKITQAMKDLNLLEKIEPHAHRVGLSYRSKAVIEPYLSKQWFVKMSSFKDKLMQAIQDKKIHMLPKNWEATYFHWISNLRDWCISRQLWWGHQIPIWYHVDNPERMICFDGEGLPEDVKASPSEWYQDEDVLDTWFSSALWPFSTLGWPNSTAELKKFYPTSVLVTGHDILFFWVARMILMGEYAMHEVPFRETFLHGLIYGKSYWKVNADGQAIYITGQERLDYDLGKTPPSDISSKWEKMSKTKGNIIDPLEIIDSYGADAMRMALLSALTHSRQIDLDRRRFEEFKNFSNKLWNSARFVIMHLQGSVEQNLSPLTCEELEKGLEGALLLEDTWILSELHQNIQTVTSHLDAYEFDKASQTSYEFFWNQFCAYYLEISKPILQGKEATPRDRKNKQKILLITLTASIRLMHPMVPFITEELFQLIKAHFPSFKVHKHVDPFTHDLLEALSKKACIVSTYPKSLDDAINKAATEDFNLINEIIYFIRNIRGDMQMPPQTKCTVYLIGHKSDPLIHLIGQHNHIIKSLIRLEELILTHEEPANQRLASLAMFKSIKIMIPLTSEMKAKEHQRLLSLQDKLTKQLSDITAILDNKQFVEKAPASLVEKHQKTLTDASKALKEVTTKLEHF